MVANLATVCLEESEVAARATRILGRPACRLMVTVGLHLAEEKLSGGGHADTMECVNAMPLALGVFHTTRLRHPRRRFVIRERSKICRTQS